MRNASSHPAAPHGGGGSADGEGAGVGAAAALSGCTSTVCGTAQRRGAAFREQANNNESCHS